MSQLRCNGFKCVYNVKISSSLNFGHAGKNILAQDVKLHASACLTLNKNQCLHSRAKKNTLLCWSFSKKFQREENFCLKMTRLNFVYLLLWEKKWCPLFHEGARHWVWGYHLAPWLGAAPVPPLLPDRRALSLVRPVAAPRYTHSKNMWGAET